MEMDTRKNQHTIESSNLQAAVQRANEMISNLERNHKDEIKNVNISFFFKFKYFLSRNQYNINIRFV